MTTSTSSTSTWSSSRPLANTTNNNNINNNNNKQQLCDSELQEFVDSVTRGVETREYKLVPVADGLGGSYFVVGPKNRHIAIFKPSQQEVGTPGNPKGNKEVEKIGFPPGMGYLREVAAYKLDYGHFARVPLTGVVTLFGEVGSVQQFVHCDGDGSYGCAKYRTDDVHRIGILDVRILNCDRHEGNLLHIRDRDCEEKQCCDVVPIDHGYALPCGAGLQDLEFDWLYYPQAKQPFSEETLRYIAALDPVADAALLTSLGFDEEVTDNVRAATLALQLAAARGFNMRQIGEFVRRTQMTQPSGLEVALAAARRDMDDNDSGHLGGSVDWDVLKVSLERELVEAEKENSSSSSTC
eukprot:PhM_4_TR18014/c1_g1_i1/m.33377